MKRSLIALLVLVLVASLCQAQPKADDDTVYVTIYDNQALVKDVRTLEQPLRKGINDVRFRDVAASIDATSVHFRSLTDPRGTRVLEQNYEFDLVNANKLLEKYIDKSITVYVKDRREPYTGTLMSFDAGRLVIAADRQAGPIFMVERGDNIRRIQFGKLPEGLLTRPTLVWEVETATPGKHLVEMSYLAGGIRWRADYNVVMAKDGKSVDLSAWVTVSNHTGTAYNDAVVKLVAKVPTIDWQRYSFYWGPVYYKTLDRMKTLSELKPTTERGDDPSRVFGNSRIYDLPVRTTIKDKQIKQVELIKQAGIRCTKKYIYDGAKFNWYRYGWYINPGYGLDQNKKVNVLVEIENRKAHGLGITLPGGKVRVYEKDTDGALEFIGEDTIEHTPRDEKVTLYIGDAFDIVGERKQTEFKKIAYHVYDESFEIKLRNHKKEKVVVEVIEKMYRGANWEMMKTNHDYKKLDAFTIMFPVEVKPDGESVITYTVRYSHP